MPELVNECKNDITHGICSLAVRTFGKQSQIIVAIEEMSELTKEITKDIRGKGNIDAISEEIVDVEIMLEQLKIIYGSDRLRAYREKKLNRLHGLIMGVDKTKHGKP